MSDKDKQRASSAKYRANNKEKPEFKEKRRAYNAKYYAAAKLRRAVID